MPRIQIGQANPLGARCPVCGAELVLHRQRRLYGREYICPVARNESYRLYHGGGQGLVGRKPGAVHEQAWLYSEGDLGRLVRGEPSSYHLQRDRMVALERGDSATYRALTAELGELLKAS